MAPVMEWPLRISKGHPIRLSTHYQRRIVVATQRSENFLQVQSVSYRPPGVEQNILNKITFSLPEKSLGLVYGRSGSGKTTLLQVLAGLLKPTEGDIVINRKVKDNGEQNSPHGRVGIVFQFPERKKMRKSVACSPTLGDSNIRYFLTDTVIEELTFGSSTRSQDMIQNQQLFLTLNKVSVSVGLTGITWDANPRSLSDGYKRRLSLAVQLVRKPDILLLDEPLAGLDWKARIDVLNQLSKLKKEITLIVVSHDLKELWPCVDKAWCMEPGGFLHERLP